MIINKAEITYKEVIINNTSIKIKQYLPIEEKYLLINNTVDLSQEENGSISPVKLEMFFNYFLITNYSDIQFENVTDDTMIGDIYDSLLNQNFLNEIIAAIPESEYSFLIQMLDKTVAATTQGNQSLLGGIALIAKLLKENYTGFIDRLEQIDLDKFKDVLTLAKATGADLEEPARVAKKVEE